VTSQECARDFLLDPLVVSGTVQHSTATMAVPFEQALQTLQSMFGGVDRLVIEELLQANGGNMDQTVDQLLQIAGDITPDDDNAPATTEAAAPAPVTDPEPNGKQYRHPLASDFLVLPEKFISEHRTSSTSSAQMREDEMLAQLLANEDFLDELRQHAEFSDYMPTGQSPRAYGSTQQQQPYFQQHGAGAIRPMNGNDDVGSYRAPGSINATGAGVPSGYGNPHFQQQQRRGHASADDNADDGMGAKILLGWSKMSAGAKSKFNALAARFKGPSDGNEYSNVPTHEPLLGSDDERSDGEDQQMRSLRDARRRTLPRGLSLHRKRDGQLEPMEQLLPSSEGDYATPSADYSIDGSNSREGVDGFQEGLGNDYAALNDGSHERLKNV
jgi:hypothetical protein